MPRIIFKCPHLKGSGETAAHGKFYVKYIATRDGVQKLDDARKLLPATRKQEKLVAELLREFPAAKEIFEYEDYIQNPTRGNASELITAVLEHNLHEITRRENYVDYIAMRPRVERMGTHGLFTDTGIPVVLEQAADEVAAHPGNVWTPIISLQREDAARLGFDHAQHWQALLSSYAAQFAQRMKIHPDHFRWYGAFHDESHHPHIHMVCWSTDPGEGFLTKQGICGIKSDLMKNIFRQEVHETYERQTQYRNELNRTAQETMSALVVQMQSGVLHSERIERLTAHLAERLRFHSGKKQYGYLKAPPKAVVDEIINELEKDTRVAEAYRLWCEMRMEVLRGYKKEPEHPGPLSRQKELSRIRNIVIEEAAKISGREFTFERDDGGETLPTEAEDYPPDEAEETPDFDMPDVPEPALSDDADTSPHVGWSEEYRQAKEYLYGSEETPRDFDKAFALFTEEALRGNALAMYDLARMYADALVPQTEMERAGGELDSASHQWYEKAFAAFFSMENVKARRYTQYRIGKMYAAGLGTEQNHSEAAAWFRKSAQQGYKYAQYSLAGLHYHGKGVEQDYPAALNLYTKSAAQGFPYASFELGKMYRDGIGTEKNAAASGSHFSKAYQGFVSLEQQSHDDKLQYRLGWMLEKGIGAEQNIFAALDFYEQAAGVGNPHAQYAWAKLILAEETASPKQAAKAAAQDNQYAAYQLGKLLLSGEGVRKNAEQAVRWFTQSAEAGNVFAQYALGKLLLMGKDVPRNKEAALRWLTLSAEQGNIYAQFFLNHFDQFKDSSVFLMASRLLHHMGNIFRDNTPRPPSGAGGIALDRKLLRKLQARKVAQGHAADDHASAQNMQI